MDYRIKKAAALNAIAATLGLSSAAVSKLDIRVGFVARGGFPDDLAKGRGFRGGYTLKQFWQLVLLFNLQRAGITLSQALQAAQSNWPLASSAIWTVMEDVPGVAYWVVHVPVLAGMEDFSVASNIEPKIYTLILADGVPLQAELAALDIINFSAVNASEVVRTALTALQGEALGFNLHEAHQSWQNAATNSLRSMLKGRLR